MKNRLQNLLNAKDELIKATQLEYNNKTLETIAARERAEITLAKYIVEIRTYNNSVWRIKGEAEDLRHPFPKSDLE